MQARWDYIFINYNMYRLNIHIKTKCGQHTCKALSNHESFSPSQSHATVPLNLKLSLAMFLFFTAMFWSLRFRIFCTWSCSGPFLDHVLNFVFDHILDYFIVRFFTSILFLILFHIMFLFDFINYILKRVLDPVMNSVLCDFLLPVFNPVLDSFLSCFWWYYWWWSWSSTWSLSWSDSCSRPKRASVLDQIMAGLFNLGVGPRIPR